MRTMSLTLSAFLILATLPAVAATAKRMSPDQARAWCNQRYPDPANLGPGMSSRGGMGMQSVRDRCVAKMSGA